MPQKIIHSRAPVLVTPHCFPVNGTIRTREERISYLYKKAERFKSEPCIWEGLFQVACLIKSKPDEEPVYRLIYDGIKTTENGSFSGSVSDQIATARAALSVFEYNTDKKILKRLAEWLRYFEIEFDTITLQDSILYRPADLMDFMIRYYNITGMKSVLRICTRIRAAAFDWTTVLHTFQQSIPIRKGEPTSGIPEVACKPEDIDFDVKESLINHAEMLADGVRYTISSGMFSGHSRDLSSGKAIWEYLSKHHRAVCGGTTGNPYLCGCAPDQVVNNMAVAAWTEAFASQMVQSDSEWALDELIRLIYNGLAECLNRDEIPEYQRINTVQEPVYQYENRHLLYARITRAAAAAYRHAVTITESGIRINYLLEGKYMFTAGNSRVILNADKQSAVFQCKDSFRARIDFHFSRFSTSVLHIKNGEQEADVKTDQHDPENGFYVRIEKNWNDGDGFILRPDKKIKYEDTHHQGICFFRENQLLTVPADIHEYAYTVCEYPETNEGKIIIGIKETDKWPVREGEPADIPVLPGGSKMTLYKEMIPYSNNFRRITMFPKAEKICSK